MILTAQKILEGVKNGKICIEPFDLSLLNPNSYNFRLGETIQIYSNEVLDTKIEQPTREITIPSSGLVLNPNELYLGHCIEIIGSDYYVPFIFGRSSIGRLGLFVEITAPLGDIGFKGQWTLQLTPVRPIKVFPNMRIGQVFFIRPHGKIELYKGKYQNSTGTRKSEIYKDF